MTHFRTVSVDFDGVLHEFSSGWTGYTPLDGPEPGALEFIKSLIVMGYTPVICSARAHNDLGVHEIKKWLKKYGFPEMKVTNEKILAICYVDDRAVEYREQNWNEVCTKIHDLAEKALTTDSPKDDPTIGASNG